MARGRIFDKIDQLQKFNEELLDLFPSSFNEYSSSKLIKAASERYVEKIVESLIDISFLIARERRLRISEQENDIFKLLVNEKIISESLMDKLKDAKGMRNIFAHQYGSVDDEIIFESISEELIDDVNQFIESINLFLHNSM